MKMRKINLESYDVKILNIDGSERMLPYNVRTSIEGIMLATGPATSQRLNMSDLLKNARIAQRITDCKEDEILIEEGDCTRIKKSFEAFSGFGRQEVEMCRRITEAKTVKVKEDKKEDEKETTEKA